MLYINKTNKLSHKQVFIIIKNSFDFNRITKYTLNLMQTIY